jgi:hypothetical protein
VLERVMRGEEVGEGMMEGARHLAVFLSLTSRAYMLMIDTGNHCP